MVQSLLLTQGTCFLLRSTFYYPGLSSLLIGIKEYIICLAWYYIVGITFGGDRTEENSFSSLEVMYSLVRRVGIVTREKSRIRIGLEEVLLYFIIDRNR